MRVGIFGSTGSIGKQTLDVIKTLKDPTMRVSILTASNNAHLLIKQAIEFKPDIVVIKNVNFLQYVQEKLNGIVPYIYGGDEAIVEVAKNKCYDMMIAAIAGYDQLPSLLEAIKAKKIIGLANKESIVIAGDLLMNEAEKNKVKIIPIDSEHSAIYQCLIGEHSPIKKIIITASGGPFRGKKTNFLINIKKEHALEHPIWSMGAKISIDSATLMNKGLELIEAKVLFGLKAQQIAPIIHPQSIVHAIVNFEDGASKAQLSLPDMKIPILYALKETVRTTFPIQSIDLAKIGALTFEEPDYKTFKCLTLAMEVLKKGGNTPIILAVANEVAVNQFLHNKLDFLAIPEVVERCLEHFSFQESLTLSQSFELLERVREYALLQSNLYWEKFIN